MPMKTEDGLGFIAFGSFIAITFQVVYTVLYTCRCAYKCGCVHCNVNLGCCCKCDKSSGSWKCCGKTVLKHGNFGQQPTVSRQQATNIHEYETKCPILLRCPHTQCSK
eukprot:UN08695